MKDLSPIEFLKLQITINLYPDWVLEDEHASGQYGLVFFINPKHANTYPPSLALKTLNPEALPVNPAQLEELQREFSKWIRLPSHRNVIAAHSFKIAGIQILDPVDRGKVHWIQIPVMSMERMSGTLTDWIGNEQISLGTKLCAIAQAFNGLSHLYANGIQGHGDLKPSNILYKDASNAFTFPGDELLKNCPWIIKVADFGWADAWIDYGFTNKALREYIAPERLGGSPAVVPEKSDVFSMGIIAAELLMGRHPSKNLQRAKKSEGEWIKHATRGDWDLSNLPSETLRNLILSCLNSLPDERPTAYTAMQLICEEINNLEGFDIAPTIDRWNREKTQAALPFISERSEEIERLVQTIGLGNQVEANSVRRLRQILKSIKPDDLYSLGDWKQAAGAILDFLKGQGAPLNQLEASQIRMHAKEHLEVLLSRVDQVDYAKLAGGLHPSDTITPFERFSHLLGHVARIADVDFEQVLRGEWNWSMLAIAGFAYHRASQARFEDSPIRTPVEYLNLAIGHAPNQAVPYFIRALRRKEALFFARLGITEAADCTMQDVIDDLLIACRLEPSWSEPRSQLDLARSDGPDPFL